MRDPKILAEGLNPLAMSYMSPSEEPEPMAIPSMSLGEDYSPQQGSLQVCIFTGKAQGQC